MDAATVERSAQTSRERLHAAARGFALSVPYASRLERRSSRRWWFAILALVSSSAISLALGEALLRVRERILLAAASPSTWAGDYNAYLAASHAGDRMFARDPSDSIVPYRNRPGFSMTIPLPSGETWSCAINSLGFRGRETPAAKPAGRFRILCLGGSTTFWGYRDDRTYPALLEERLRAILPGRDLEVLNLGVSGYTTRMNVERLRREYRPLSPDLVIFYEGVNDLMTLAPARYRHRYLQSLLFATVLNLQAARSESGGDGEGSGLAPLVREQFAARIAPSYEALGREARDAGARLLVMTFPGPDGTRLSDVERRFLEAELYRSWRSLGSLRSYLSALEAYNDELRVWARESGTPLLDLAASLKGTTDFFMDLCHLNTSGLDRVAEAVAGEIISRGWLENRGG